MNIDLLAQDSYIMVNKKLAEIFGISEAVYLSELFNISKKAVNKKSFDPATGFFKLDRKYITKQTTISPDKQCEYDLKFKQIGLVDVNPDNIDMICIDTTVVISLITSTDMKAIKSISTNIGLDKETKKQAKKDAIIQMLKNSVVENDPDLHAAYETWIDSCYGKVTTKAQVKVFVDSINSYTDSKEVKIALISIGTASQYRDAAWCIQIYEKNKAAYRTNTTKQKVSSGLSDVSF